MPTVIIFSIVLIAVVVVFWVRYKSQSIEMPQETLNKIYSESFEYKKYQSFTDGRIHNEWINSFNAVMDSRRYVLFLVNAGHYKKKLFLSKKLKNRYNDRQWIPVGEAWMIRFEQKYCNTNIKRDKKARKIDRDFRRDSESSKIKFCRRTIFLIAAILVLAFIGVIGWFVNLHIFFLSYPLAIKAVSVLPELPLPLDTERKYLAVEVSRNPDVLIVVTIWGERHPKEWEPVLQTIKSLPDDTSWPAALKKFVQQNLVTIIESADKNNAELDWLYKSWIRCGRPAGGNRILLYFYYREVFEQAMRDRDANQCRTIVAKLTELYPQLREWLPATLTAEDIEFLADRIFTDSWPLAMSSRFEKWIVAQDSTTRAIMIKNLENTPDRFCEQYRRLANSYPHLAKKILHVVSAALAQKTPGELKQLFAGMLQRTRGELLAALAPMLKDRVDRIFEQALHPSLNIGSSDFLRQGSAFLDVVQTEVDRNPLLLGHDGIRALIAMRCFELVCLRARFVDREKRYLFLGDFPRFYSLVTLCQQHIPQNFRIPWVHLGNLVRGDGNESENPWRELLQPFSRQNKFLQQQGALDLAQLALWSTRLFCYLESQHRPQLPKTFDTFKKQLKQTAVSKKYSGFWALCGWERLCYCLRTNKLNSSYHDKARDYFKKSLSYDAQNKAALWGSEKERLLRIPSYNPSHKYSSQCKSDAYRAWQD